MPLPKRAFRVPPSYPSPVGFWHEATLSSPIPDRSAQSRVPSMGGAPASLPSTRLSPLPEAGLVWNTDGPCCGQGDKPVRLTCSVWFPAQPLCKPASDLPPSASVMLLPTRMLLLRRRRRQRRAGQRARTGGVGEGEGVRSAPPQQAPPRHTLAPCFI